MLLCLNQVYLETNLFRKKKLNKLIYIYIAATTTQPTLTSYNATVLALEIALPIIAFLIILVFVLLVVYFITKKYYFYIIIIIYEIFFKN